MKFDLKVELVFSSDIAEFKKDVEDFISEYSETNFENKELNFENIDIKKDKIVLNIVSKGQERPHNILLNLKNNIAKHFGKKHHIGVRNINIKNYVIGFELEKKPLHKTSIPFADLEFEDQHVKLTVSDVDEEFLQKNYIDRMIKRVVEKVEDQYYEGKGEFWKLIWESGVKKPVWTKDPTEEMIKLGWLKQGPTKGKWFYRPQAAAVLKTMEKIAVEEILKPLGFQEIIESHIVPFDIWLKTGHMEGMPGEFYYVCEPKTRDTEKWEQFVDIAKITKEIPIDELEKNVSLPNSGICYAQCPMIYWSLKGKTISEDSLPVLLFDKTAVSGRYESGGRHGIERVDEFHRLEPVYIGTREQLLELREKMLKQYKHVFNDIFDLEWRMAWVTPWYMQQAGEHGETTQDCGTIDFEAYMPYRGDRKKSEWLEFQNLSIIGEKYVKAFNIKAQKSLLWSGCSGIGLQRWATAFLAQKGLNPESWPERFRKYLDKIPEGIKFL